MDDDGLLDVAAEVVASVRAALDGLGDWGPAGTKPGQYLSDLAADEAALGVLSSAGLAVLSEESGWHDGSEALLAVIDPVDGSTNASRGIPWFATSVCILDEAGPRVALVVNQASGTRFDAIRGRGARCDGRAVRPSSKTTLAETVVGLSGWPPRHLGWRQFRALGACSLDLAAVAAGVLDAYIDCSDDAHGPWDYLGGLLVCTEAGAAVCDAKGRDLVGRAHADRRTVLAAGTEVLLAQVRGVRTGVA